LQLLRNYTEFLIGGLKLNTYKNQSAVDIKIYVTVAHSDFGMSHTDLLSYSGGDTEMWSFMAAGCS